MARPKKGLQRVDDAKSWMTRHRVDPVDKLCQEACLEYKLTEAEASHPSIVAMTGQGYELIPAPGGDGWLLRLGVTHRITIWRTLASYVYPQLRASEQKVESNQNINVVIKNFAIPATPLSPLTPPVPRLIDVTADGDDDAVHRNNS